MKPFRLPHQETVMSLDLRALIKETINFKCSSASRRVFSTQRYNLQCIVRKTSSPLTSPGGVSVTMGGCARLGARRWAAFAGAAFFCAAAIFSLPFKASAQNTAIVSRGDAAVTAFSGARQLGEVPSGLHPLDVTFIDVNGARCST
jgi:hypothetical protein